MLESVERPLSPREALNHWGQSQTNGDTSH